MTRLKRAATATSLLAELSHVFCCGLPMAVAVLSAGSQVGLGGVFLGVHDTLHAYEVPIMVTSGVLLALGLALHYVSYMIDCREVACGNAHPPCAPKKFQVGWIFTIALVLFIANVAYYVLSSHGGS